MIAYNLALAAGVVVDAWLLALMVLRGRRPWLQATFAALALTFIANDAAFVGTDQGFLTASWGSVVIATMVLAHPLITILVLGLVHGESLPRRKAVTFLLLAAVPEFVLVTPAAEWTAQHAYDLNPLGGFLIVCLAIALAEPIFQRLTSSLYFEDALWLTGGVLALIVGGPVYTFEFEALGLGSAAGSNVVAPVALAAFAVVALRAAPYPATVRGGRHRWSGEGRLVRGMAYAFEERRPVYALQAMREGASDGRPALLIARSSAPSNPDLAGPAAALVEPSRHAASRVMTTASEFLARFPGGLVALVDLGDIAMMSGWRPTREMIVRLRQVAKDTSSTLLLATGCLTETELEDLRRMTLAWWTLPDPAEEIEAILGRFFGPGAKQLLVLFARTRGLRPADLTVDNVPALLDFMNRAISELGAPVTDPAALQGLRDQTGSAAKELRAFASRSPAELSTGDWPSIAAAASDRDLVVTADGYWKGREMDEGDKSLFFFVK